jgi:hypothetical protein
MAHKHPSGQDDPESGRQPPLKQPRLQPEPQAFPREIPKFPESIFDYPTLFDQYARTPGVTVAAVMTEILLMLFPSNRESESEHPPNLRR